MKAASQPAPGTRSPATGHSASSPRDTATGPSASSPRDTATSHSGSIPPDAAPGRSASGPRDVATGPSALGPRDRSNDTPCTSAAPARAGSTALPASPPYNDPHASDVHLADPVEPRDPLADEAEPYDPDPPSDPFDTRPMGYVPGPRTEPHDGVPMDGADQRALDTRLAQIKRDAYTHPASATAQVRPGQAEVFVHLTDLTLATGTGVLRAEGIGPLLADQLTELVGHGPYTVKPVIDLNDAVSADAYEIPTRIRERVRLTYPVELFPYGTRETHGAIDLDHIEPYDPYGPPCQTSTRNLAPLSRFAHRVKTHARGWNVRRVDVKTLEWTTPHGFTFHVDPTGTHRLPNSPPAS
jgi:hypothetical protein